MNKKQKYETVQDLIDVAINHCAENFYDEHPFMFIEDEMYDGRILENFEKLPDMPKKEVVAALVKESEALKKYFNRLVEECAEGLIQGVINEVGYREEQEREEREAKEEEERFEKERKKEEIQRQKELSRKNKQKQILVKTLNESQKKALQELGINL